MPGVRMRFDRKHLNHIREMVSQGTGATVGRDSRHKKFVKAGVVFAAFLICLLAVTPALAAGTPAGYELLYLLSPKTAQRFKPVQKTAVDQGIEVSVVSAYVHEDTAQALISVRDTTSDRLDDTIDLYDSYDFKTGFDSIGTCDQVDYDAQTKTALFLVTMSSMNSKDLITGEKITFTLQTLLSGKEEALGVPVQVDWSMIPETVETETADPYEETVLIPGETMLAPYEGFYVTGIGYVEGKLHVQLYTPGRNKYDDHAFLYLQDENGERTEGDLMYRGGYNASDANDERRADYIDYAFGVPQSELEKYTLFGDFYCAKTRVDGYWSITFPLENEPE